MQVAAGTVCSGCHSGRQRHPPARVLEVDLYELDERRGQLGGFREVELHGVVAPLLGLVRSRCAGVVLCAVAALHAAGLWVWRQEWWVQCPCQQECGRGVVSQSTIYNPQSTTNNPQSGRWLHCSCQQACGRQVVSQSTIYNPSSIYNQQSTVKTVSPLILPASMWSPCFTISSHRHPGEATSGSGGAGIRPGPHRSEWTRHTFSKSYDANTSNTSPNTSRYDHSIPSTSRKALNIRPASHPPCHHG